MASEITISPEIRSRILSALVTYINWATDGGDGATTEQANRRLDEIEYLIDNGNLDDAWTKALAWLEWWQG